MNRPTLRQLEYLVALAEARHFGRAARAAHVSQPGLSAQIRTLERTLETQLFERDRGGVLLTAAGEAALVRARRALAEVDGLVEEAASHARPLSGPLRLGVIPTVGPYLLPQVLPRLERAHPDLRLLLHEDRTSRLVEALDRGHLDVLLLALEADLGRAVTLPLFADPFLLAVRHDAPLARGARIRTRDLDGVPVLLLEDGHCLRDQAWSFCRAAGSLEIADVRATSLPTLVQMAAQGVGVTLLPELARDHVEAAHPVLALIPFQAPCPQRTIGLAWRSTSGRRRELELLGRRFRAAHA